jgi:uncharacterized heparinase superfamily protein
MPLQPYYHTIRHLRPGQIYYRLYYTFKRKLYERLAPRVYRYYQRRWRRRNFVDKAWPEAFSTHRRVHYRGDLEALIRNEFTFLNRRIDFGARIDWNQPKDERGADLWHFNLQYQEWLIDVAHAWRRDGDPRWRRYLEQTLESWIAHNPFGAKDYAKGAWNSYCLSLRALSWMKIYALAGQAMSTGLRAAFLESLWIQCAFLRHNLELDLLGNHLIKNWKTLRFAAVFFDEPAFAARARRLFNRHVAPQFTPAGMHEELSPMYAGIVLEDLLEVYSLEGDTALEPYIHRLHDCVRQLSCEGEYAFFNDSVNWNEVQPGELEALYQALFPQVARPESPRKISADGYLGFAGPAATFLFDAAPAVAGPQPGHTHCDALSFEAWVGGRKLFTNSGVYEYLPGAARAYARAAAAHNTLRYGEREQSEIWGGFRLARRAKVGFRALRHEAEELLVEAWVEGFTFRPRTTHRRRVWAHPGGLEVLDRVSTEAIAPEMSSVFFHLAPPFRFALDPDDAARAFIRDGEQTLGVLRVEGPAKLSVETTPFFPEFGKRLEKSTLVLSQIPPETDIRSVVDWNALLEPARANERGSLTMKHY